MKVICVSSFDELKKIANNFSCDAGNEVLYRGTSNSLVPSIIEKYPSNSYSDLIDKEHLLLSDFKKYSNIKYMSSETKALDWEIRIAAREHGLLSSLMDWSNSLNAAIEFAIYNFEAKKIDFTSLWILNTVDLPRIEIGVNKVSKEFGKIFDPTIVQLTVYDEESFLRRKFVQGGFFLKQSYQNIHTSLEYNPILSDKLVHLIIPSDIVPSLREKRASEVNIDLNLMATFNNPTAEALDSICNELNKKYL